VIAIYGNKAMSRTDCVQIIPTKTKRSLIAKCCEVTRVDNTGGNTGPGRIGGSLL
jgi:hypothetical protein